MRFSQARIVASKDLAVFRHRRSVIYSTVFLPVVISVGLPLVIEFAGARRGGLPASAIPTLLDAFAFLFLVGAAVLPTAIASYSLVGEKIQRSLEPLLATPTTDAELLLGKSMAALAPPLLAIWIGGLVYMVFTDLLTHTTLGYWYFPDWNMALVLLLGVPLAAILSIEASIVISARATDVRAAQIQGGLIALPFGLIYIASEIGIFSLSTGNLLILSAAIAAVDIALFFLAVRVFQREEILTRWK